MLDCAAPIDQYADLAMELCALCSELHSELSRDDFARCDSATVQSLERLDLARLRPARFPVTSSCMRRRNLPIARRITTDIVRSWLGGFALWWHIHR